jgi:hypothetical protein
LASGAARADPVRDVSVTRQWVTSVARYQTLRRQRHVYAMAQLGQHVARMDWPAERTAAERNLRLRRLLEFARERSPWHRDRLTDVDVGTF